MNYYLNGEKVASDELAYILHLLLDGVAMQVEKIENNNIYFTIIKLGVK